MDHTMPKHDVVDEIANACLMSCTRRLSRVLTAIYDEELRPLGLRPGQLSLLVLIAKAGVIKRTDIGRISDLDPSTLTRNLALLFEDGWIEEVTNGRDRRGNPVRLTSEGHAVVGKAAAPWKKAQQRTRKLLGKYRADALISLFGPMAADRGS